MRKLGMVRAESIGIVLVLAAFPAQPAARAQEASGVHITPVLKESKTVAGEPIEYNAKNPEITAVRVQIDPGKGTNFITHPVPTFIYVLDGALTEEYEDGTTQTYEQGTGFLQSMQKAHRRRNLGTKPVTILVVYVSDVGKVNAVPAHPTAAK